MSPSELLLLQLPQLPRLARTLPEELLQSELESEQDFSTRVFPGFGKYPSAGRKREELTPRLRKQVSTGCHLRSKERRSEEDGKLHGRVSSLLN